MTQTSTMYLWKVIMSKRINFLFQLTMILPLAATVICFPFVPDTIPAYYNTMGEITRYGSKVELFLLPLTTIAFGFFMISICKFSSRNMNKPAVYWIYGICLIPMILFNVLTYQFLIHCF